MLGRTNESLLEKVEHMRRLVEDLSKQDLAPDARDAAVRQIEADLQELCKDLPADVPR
jgi:hypothetical protein